LFGFSAFSVADLVDHFTLVVQLKSSTTFCGVIVLSFPLSIESFPKVYEKLISCHNYTLFQLLKQIKASILQFFYISDPYICWIEFYIEIIKCSFTYDRELSIEFFFNQFYERKYDFSKHLILAFGVAGYRKIFV
jgi:hypothetical protein